MTQALEDIRVADFTQMMQGPWATQKLADMGADVIKVEPIGGEWERKAAAAGDQFHKDESPFFLAMNRNKRSITLDLKDEDGHRVAMDLCRSADVVAENFRPGTMERLGLGYEEVREENPEVVYVSASGFGPSGPYVERPGQDLLLQAMSGLTEITGRKDDPPTPAGTPIVDEHAATLIAFKTAIALFHRERTGMGQRVNVNLLDASIDFQCQEITASLNLDHEFERSEEGIAFQYLGAPYGIYETANGHLAIAMTPLEKIADSLDMPELESYDGSADDYIYRDEIKRRIEDRTKQSTTEELLNSLLEADIWAAEVNDYEEMSNDPQVEHNDMIVELDHPFGGTFETTGIPGSFSETPGEIKSGPPAPGEHSVEILEELGFGDSEIESLRESGITQMSD